MGFSCNGIGVTQAQFRRGLDQRAVPGPKRETVNPRRSQQLHVRPGQTTPGKGMCVQQVQTLGEVDLVCSRQFLQMA